MVIVYFSSYYITMKITKDMVKQALEIVYETRNSDEKLLQTIRDEYNIDLNDIEWLVNTCCNIKRRRAWFQNTKWLYLGDPEIMLKRYKHSRYYCDEMRATKTQISNRSLLSRVFRW